MRYLDFIKNAVPGLLTFVTLDAYRRQVLEDQGKINILEDKHKIELEGFKNKQTMENYDLKLAHNKLSLQSLD